MVTVFFANGKSAELAEATSAQVNDRPGSNLPPQIEFLDPEGKIVARFRSDHVVRYTVDSNS